MSPRLASKSTPASPPPQRTIGRAQPRTQPSPSSDSSFAPTSPSSRGWAKAFKPSTPPSHLFLVLPAGRRGPNSGSFGSRTAHAHAKSNQPSASSFSAVSSSNDSSTNANPSAGSLAARLAAFSGKEREAQGKKINPADVAGEVCPACSKPLNGVIYKALDSRWHKTCFNCGNCSSPIVLPGRYIGKEGRPYCMNCKDALTRCLVCKKGVTGRGGCYQIPGRGPIHAECYQKVKFRQAK